jgi:hypothetical protein
MNRVLSPIRYFLLAAGCLPFLLFGQGFGTSPTTWGLPSGGVITSGGITAGYDEPSYSNAHQTSAGSENWTLQDMTGDGKPDLVVTSEGNGTIAQEFSPSSNSYWKVYVSTGSGFNTSPTAWSLPNGGMISGSGITWGYYLTSNINATTAGSENWDLRDMTGDGKPDLVVTGVGNGTITQEFSPSSNSYWKVYTNTGSGFNTSPTTWALPDGGVISTGGITGGYNRTSYSNAHQTSAGSENWNLQDMTGDGKPDLVVTSEGNGTIAQEFSPSSNSYWKVYINNGSGFNTSPFNWGLPSGGALGTGGITWGYYVTTDAGANTIAGSENWTLQDMTGDGKPDLVVTSVGNGTIAQEFSPSSNSYWKVYTNTGTSFSTSPTNWGLPSGGALGTGGITWGYYLTTDAGANTIAGSENWTLQDITGDGKPDLVVTSVGNGSIAQEFSPSSNSYWKVYANTGSGFNTSPTNWGLPSGGTISTGGITWGYYLTSYTNATTAGSENWTVEDMTGDGRPDMVVTGVGNGTIAQEFSPSSNSYWKVYTNAFLTNVDELAAASAVRLYPNPAHDHVVVETDEIILELRLLDAQGRLVLSERAGADRATLPVADLKAGMYTLQLVHVDHVRTARVVVE